jgi:hypothetical protein
VAPQAILAHEFGHHVQYADGLMRDALPHPRRHGGPNCQRMRSALWAYGLADAARPQGHILPALGFYDLFKAHYPQLIAPDATS